MNNFKVVEKFISINGEGSKAGQLAAFIRFQGCNLNCSYCDSKYANSDDAKYGGGNLTNKGRNDITNLNQHLSMAPNSIVILKKI